MARAGWAPTRASCTSCCTSPTRRTCGGWKAGDPVDREVRLLVAPDASLRMVEAVVSVTSGEVRDWHEIEGMRPALFFGEAMNAMFTTKEHPDYIAAMARRGITDLDQIQIDPWPAGSFGYDAETDRRIARCISFWRETPEDNGYARPIEGVIVHFDLGRNEVIEVIDHGAVSLPDRARALLRRGPRAAPHRHEAARDHAARGTELHRRRQPRRAGAAGRCASRSTRTRASCCTR